MNIIEKRQAVHSLIDEVENERLLEELYKILHRFHTEKNSVDFWEQFTEQQQKELELALEESENEQLLVEHSRVMEEAKSWITK